jgi:transcription-repair coupling factor (superfamily II helicase)
MPHTGEISFADTLPFARLIELLGRERSVQAGGLCASAVALLTAQLRQGLKKSLLVVTKGEQESLTLASDTELFVSLSRGKEVRNVFHIPALLDPIGEISVNLRPAALRLAAASRLIDAADSPVICVCSGRAVSQKLPAPEAVKDALFHLSVAQKISPDSLSRRLTDAGFERVAEVERYGQFVRRGGIVDIFAPLSGAPIRVEFADDRIESIRQFETQTQRSSGPLEDASVILLSPEKIASAAFMSGSIDDYLKRDAITVLVEESSADSVSLLDVAKRGVLCVSALPAPESAASVNSHTSPAGRTGGAIGDVMEHLRRAAQKYQPVYIFCPTSAECERIAQLMRDYQIKSESVQFAVGRLSAGFHIDDINLAVLSANELFDRYERPVELREERGPVTGFFEIERGDYCVHADYGLCKFLAVEVVTKGKRSQEFAILQFRDNVKLSVPASRFDLIQKYVGGKRPHLSRLGTPAWENRKKRVKDALKDIAKELLLTQAERTLKAGTAFPKDTEWQRAFEASFSFEETPDQMKTAVRVKEDMESARPMDRLIAGDVGYGKTEIAMRAAFKSVEFGKQVAVLVPTTVLAEQHYRTFKERMAQYPFFIEVLSRFKSRAQQREIIEKTRRGEIDILIGTHRLFSPDVQFADLGLVIIDEEQRFGVMHKEHLKSLRKTVDILTLTATPIPRTLNMALVGVKDISTLATPPRGRESIVTRVLHWDKQLVKEALTRELERGGQAYFVHNRVENIEEMREDLEALFPEAIFISAHGQMDETLLEKRMIDFINRKIDVLVCTTIIENGLDIPNVNTIFINDAQRFGLADLHQLRGRVGRYQNQAFAYLFIPSERGISRSAKSRLKAIEEFDELGAGFKLAMRDLEIRGAGNLLGREQSGHIAAVGYEMYCHLLARAIGEAKKEKVLELPSVEVDFEVPAFLPEDYVQDIRIRIDLYRRIAQAVEVDEISELKSELEDRFGKLPREADNFLTAALVRVLARKLSLRYIGIREKALAMRFERLSTLSPLSKILGTRGRLVGEDFLYVSLHRGKSSPENALRFTAEILQKAAPSV